MQALFKYFSSRSVSSSKVQSPRELVVGDKVNTKFGKVCVNEIRADKIYVVKLDNWKLANGKSPTLYLNKSSLQGIDLVSHRDNISKAFATPFVVGDVVKSTFGEGTIRTIRSDGIHVVDLKNWALANGCKPVLYMNAQSITKVSAPSSSGAVSPISVPVIVPVGSAKPVSPFKVGDNVKTTFGVGKITAIRSDNIHVCSLYKWDLANGCKPTLYMNPSSLIKSAGPTDLIPGDKVKCSFGVGVVKSIRDDGIVIVSLDNWSLANNSKPVLFMNPNSVTKAGTITPTGGFKVGDRVSTSFGEGQIIEIRKADNIHVVTLFKWILANKKSPKLYLNSKSLSLISRPNNITTLYNEALKSEKLKKRMSSILQFATGGIVGGSSTNNANGADVGCGCVIA